MPERLRSLILWLARVPHEPTPPAGAPGSARLFRAGRNYYKLKLARWSVAQAGAVIGILFSLWFLAELDRAYAGFDAPSAQVVRPGAAAAPPAADRRAAARDRTLRRLRDQAGAWPRWTILLLHVAEAGAIAIFVVQLPVTLIGTRLDFEQHWYIVTDRSLRIRTGIVRLQEATMSFANLQQVEVVQGPLQRLLGIADVHVRSAGGGGGEGAKHRGESMHEGIFQGVENAHEIRDLILARLRRFREAGLGDPDEVGAAAPVPADAGALAAARDLLAEVRQLRAVATARR